MQMWFHSEKCRAMHSGKYNPNTKYTLPTDDGTLHKLAKTAEEKDLGSHYERQADIFKTYSIYIYIFNKLNLPSLRSSLSIIL